MAGRGPAPKPAGRRSRPNPNQPNFRLVEYSPTPQPDLPQIQLFDDGELVDFRWPAVTREWWKMWAQSPLSADFTDSDWSFLADTALLHARYWLGDTKVAGELRLRVAKFGATPEDRLRLKIQFEVADEIEDKGSKRRTAKSREAAKVADPREALKVV